MVEEVSLKMHLIITDIHEEYSINWCGRIIDSHPVFENNKPVFVIIGSDSRMELSTIDMKQLEECAKRLTNPRGRGAVMIDKARIYIKEESGDEKLLGIVTHKRIKSYAPMHDKVGWR